MDQPTLTRRDALKVSAFAAAALAMPLTATLTGDRVSQLDPSKMPRPYATSLLRPKEAQPSEKVTDEVEGHPVYQLTMQQFEADIVPGFTTTMWGYGDTAATEPEVITATFPGPTIVARRGQPIVVRFINDLPPKHPVFGYVPTTSVHLHGHPSRPQYDGYANDTTLPGQYKDYVYENDEDARTIWYHDHAVHHTAENVAMGLAGQYHVTDPDDPLPSGEYDWPLTISDIAFTARGQLLYDDRSDSGFMGDTILVNGKPWPVLKVEPRKYRFRLVNASIARGYRLRLSSGSMTVVSTDGGFLREPVKTTDLRIGMGERYSIVIDFADYPMGTRVELRNSGVPNSIDYDHTNKVMAFDVVKPKTSDVNNVIPAILVPTRPPGEEAPLPVMDLQPGMESRRRRLEFERGGSEWTINDQTWHDVEASRFRRVIADPALKAVELWTLENGSGGWFHPIHLHLVDFKVIDRNGRPPRPYENGPKDVVYLGENERVRIMTRFGPHDGKYMIHCHNNTHEDHDMMHQMQVGVGGPDPINFARPQPLPAPPTTQIPG